MLLDDCDGCGCGASGGSMGFASMINSNFVGVRYFNQQYKSNSKLYNTPGFTTHNLCATYYIERKMNIDNILTSGFKKVQGSKCQWYPTNIEEGLLEYGSDHMPVIIEVEPAA